MRLLKYDKLFYSVGVNARDQGNMTQGNSQIPSVSIWFSKRFGKQKETKGFSFALLSVRYETAFGENSYRIWTWR